ncbi:MAG: o-succinylbenzoate synthase [Prevotellaceae bacterium]|jgi:o-succinylbenzoate synthase|nr:o-succinylbenzoate synthase [Prevotellaceae bacterium]
MKASFHPCLLEFKRPAATSRETMASKLTYLLKIQQENNEYTGECGFFKGLSADPEAGYEAQLQWVCENIEKGKDFLWEACRKFPSIQFGIEQVFKQLKNQQKDFYFSSDFTEGKHGILINGLIWMGTPEYMREQIQQKLAQKFTCIKLKIGTNWDGEYQILKQLRTEFPASQLELRVDANGGFSYGQAPKILEQLAELEIHSIEQPIKAHQESQMADLCKNTPVPIALDEELIGKFHLEEKEKLLQEINPQYIILKPSLVGGWRGSQEWIDCAERQSIGWWITSALESNIGLNAIAQWTAVLRTQMPQGLGTGSLYINNFPTKLEVRGEKLFYNP